MTISNSAHWQPTLTGDGIVEGIDDVDQSIRLILGTPLGSDPHRPTFGCDLNDLLDAGFTQTAPVMVQRATDAILLWESRVKKVAITPMQGEARAWIKVNWWPADNVMREAKVIL